MSKNNQMMCLHSNTKAGHDVGLSYSLALIKHYLKQRVAKEKQLAKRLDQSLQAGSLAKKLRYFVVQAVRKIISPSWLYDYSNLIDEAISEFSLNVNCEPNLGTVEYLLSLLKLRIGNNVSQDEALPKVLDQIAAKTGVNYESIEAPDRINALSASLLR